MTLPWQWALINATDATENTTRTRNPQQAFMDCGERADKAKEDMTDCLPMYEALQACMEKNKGVFDELLEEMKAEEEQRGKGGEGEGEGGSGGSGSGGGGGSSSGGSGAEQAPAAEVAAAAAVLQQEQQEQEQKAADAAGEK